MSNQHEIPQVRLASRDDLFDIVHFNISMALETEDIALNNEEITQGVQAVFDDSHLGRYCVATINNQIVGSLLLTTEWSDWHNKYYWWIQSVYVNPDTYLSDPSVRKELILIRMKHFLVFSGKVLHP